MTPPRSLFRIALACLAAGPLAAQATVFKGPPGGKGDVWVYSAPGAAGARPPKLRGIVLLPVDATGRSALTQFQPDQARQKLDLPLAARVLLPQGQGSLYRFRRERAGGADFGYFIVGPNGLASFLADFPGTGPDGLGDPIPNPIAISAQGDAFLTATTLAAGGDVYEVGIGTSQAQALTGALPPQEILPQGLILLSSWGSALTRNGPLRFDRGGNASFVPLGLRARPATLGSNPSPAAQLYFGNGLVKSADDSTVAVIAGAGSKQAHVFTFGARGAPLRVNEVPSAIVDPGFGTQASPTLALSTDGSRVAWKANVLTGVLSGECFSRKASRLTVPLEHQVTGDQSFTDTLNDTGVIAFFGTDKLLMMVGEGNGAGGVEKADLYLADFSSGAAAPSLTNLSATSGDSVAPFLEKGDLETSDGIYQVPGKLQFVYYVPGSSGQGFIYHLDGATGNVDTIRNGVAQMNYIEQAGSNFVVGILQDHSSQRELLAIPFDHSRPSPSLAYFPGAQTMARTSGNAAGGFAGILNVGTSQMLGQLDVNTQTGDLVNTPARYGPVVGFDGAGRVLASLQTPTNTYFVTWVPGAPLQFYSSSPQGLVLPGN